MTLSRLLWRLLIAGLGFSAAVAVGVIVAVLAFGTLDGADRLAAGDGAGVGVLIAAGLRGGLLLPVFHAVVWPAWAAAVLIGEATATRSLLAHLVVATGIAVVGLVGTLPVVGLASLRAVVAVGLVAGFTHWLIAGRGAGLRAPSREPGAPRMTEPHEPR